MLIESQKEFKNGNLEQKMKIINLTTHELFFDNKKQLSFVFTKPFQVLQKMQFL
jgi:hypothetical protein